MSLRCDSCHINSEIQCRNCAMTTQHALNDANERLATANQRITELEAMLACPVKEPVPIPVLVEMKEETWDSDNTESIEVNHD